MGFGGRIFLHNERSLPASSCGARGVNPSDIVTAANDAPLDYPCKNALARHDAISGQVVDCAFFVAFLADLGDFHQNRFAQPEPGAHRTANPVDSFGCNVFGKISEAD
jgi:hypothetical protein